MSFENEAIRSTLLEYKDKKVSIYTGNHCFTGKLINVLGYIIIMNTNLSDETTIKISNILAVSLLPEAYQ